MMLLFSYLSQSSLEDTSVEHIRSSEYYPKGELIADDHRMELPFPCLCGESARFLGKTSDGTIALSNFRLVVCYKDSFVNIPLGLVEMIECRDIFYLHIYCKDSRIVRCTFSTNDACLEWYKRLSDSLCVPKALDKVFAFAFHAWCEESNYTNSVHINDVTSTYQLFGDTVSYSFGREVERMEFNLKRAWRITYINENYKFCPTYPKYHIVPKSIKDEDLQSAASFRTSRRIPSVVWRDRTNGAILARCSQPEVGWLGWRNTEDEKLLQELALACALDCDLAREAPVANGHSVSNGDVAQPHQPARKMLILDARSYTAAVANRAKGGGCECPEYYPNCDIQFMNLANIHSVRKSFHALRTLCAGGADQPNWLSLVENSRWLAHISGLMKASLVAVHAIDKDATPVVVHCSDGWDRTPQIVALAELMLDPFYRTFEGFQALVEREWLDFGHKFADRCGHGIHCDDSNERCPVFLQFLDCVYQLMMQFPCAFEYNETFLVKLVQHTYSCLFGTFLCNSAFERDEASLAKKTFSVWTLLKQDNWKVKNYLYAGSPTPVLRPVCHVRNLRLWASVFLCNTAPLSDGAVEDHTDSQNLPVLPKTRSCDDIVAALEHTTNLNRTSSDPNLASEALHEAKFLLQKEIETVDRRLEVSVAQDAVKFDNRSSSPESDVVKSSAENSATESDADERNGDDASTDGELTVVNGNNGDGGPACASDSEETIYDGLSNGLLLHNGNGLPAFTNGNDVFENGNVLYENGGVCENGADLVNVNDYSRTAKLNGDRTLSNECLDKLDGSTDTITSDLVKSMSSPVRLSNGDDDLNKLQATISTSTTDISDSHVRINLNQKFCFNGQSLKINDLTLNLAPSNGDLVKQSRSCQTEKRSSTKTSSAGSESSVSTPYNSRSSSCPDTPAAETKAPEPAFSSRSVMNNLARRIDVDGLTLDLDPVQYRLHQKELEYHHRIAVLERHLQGATTALYHYTLHCNGNRANREHRDELCSLPESTGSGEMMSLGQCSNPASDLSWEAVEEKDANMTLWVPDHAVTHCTGCREEFWIVRRRHHCRNCGRVFCGACTDFFIAIPQQQLPDPVRVCRSCYSQLGALQSSIFVDAADHLITAAEG